MAGKNLDSKHKTKKLKGKLTLNSLKYEDAVKAFLEVKPEPKKKKKKG